MFRFWKRPSDGPFAQRSPEGACPARRGVLTSLPAEWGGPESCSAWWPSGPSPAGPQAWASSSGGRRPGCGLGRGLAPPAGLSGTNPSVKGAREARQALSSLAMETSAASAARPASFPASAGARLPRGRPLRSPAWRAASLSLRASPPPRQMAVGRKLDALQGSRALRGGGAARPAGLGCPQPGRGRRRCFDISSKEGT